MNEFIIAKIRKVIIDYTLLLIVILFVGGIMYSFAVARYYTLGAVMLFAGIVYMLGYTRSLAFRIDKIFKNVNESFWNLMIIINQFFNGLIFRYSLATVCLFFFFRLLYYMFNLIS